MGVFLFSFYFFFSASFSLFFWGPSAFLIYSVAANLLFLGAQASRPTLIIVALYIVSAYT